MTKSLIFIGEGCGGLDFVLQEFFHYGVAEPGDVGIGCRCGAVETVGESYGGVHAALEVERFGAGGELLDNMPKE